MELLPHEVVRFAHDSAGTALRIERGAPTDEELAALVGVLLARPPAAPAGRVPASRWVASARPGAALDDGRPSRTGPGAWRTSALPR